MDEILKNSEAGGEKLSDTEKITAGLSDFVKKAKEQEDFEEWREYDVPVELEYNVEPILRTLKKNAIDYEFDTLGLKYDDYLDDFLGVNVDEEDFYDFETGYMDDDAYSDAKYANRLQKINAMNEDESFRGYGFAEGFNFFNVKYAVGGGENEGKNLTYTRNILSNDKSVPDSMTTRLAELLIKKLKESGQDGDKTAAEVK